MSQLLVELHGLPPSSHSISPRAAESEAPPWWIGGFEIAIFWITREANMQQVPPGSPGSLCFLMFSYEITTCFLFAMSIGIIWVQLCTETPVTVTTGAKRAGITAQGALCWELGLCSNFSTKTILIYHRCHRLDATARVS